LRALGLAGPPSKTAGVVSRSRRIDGNAGWLLKRCIGPRRWCRPIRVVGKRQYRSPRIQSWIRRQRRPWLT